MKDFTFADLDYPKAMTRSEVYNKQTAVLWNKVMGGHNNMNTYYMAKIN